MNYFIGIMPIIAFVFALVNGKLPQMSEAILDKAGDAVTLALSLCGIMCFWCGLMRVAEKADLVKGISRLLSPLLRILFRGLKKGGRAEELIALNLSANILGLGNASTPLGISAIQALADEEQCDHIATDNMIMLTVLNTASLQIIPTTAAALRAAFGAAEPMDILPCVWIVSLYSATITVVSAKIMGAIRRRRAYNRYLS